MIQMSQHPQNPSSAETSTYLLWSLDHTRSWFIQSKFCRTIVEKLNNLIPLEYLSHSANKFYSTQIISPWPR
jgi:hypothetical protein